MRKNSNLSARPISELGLTIQSVAFLRRIGITKLGDLVDRCRVTGLYTHNADANCVEEIDRAIRCLLRASTVEWSAYRSLYDAGSAFPMMPHEDRVAWSGYAFIKDLPAAVRDVVKLQFGEKHAVVLDHRLLQARTRRYSLRELGSKLGVTRERIYYMEKRITHVLRSALLHDEYRRCRFRFRTAFTEPLRAIARGARTKRMTDHSWSVLIEEIWTIRRSELGATEPLILKLLDITLS